MKLGTISEKSVSHESRVTLVEVCRRWTTLGSFEL